MNRIAPINTAQFDLTETLENIDNAASSFEIFKQLKATGAAFDLPRFLVTGQPDNTARAFVQRVIITNWDAELMTRFVESKVIDRSGLAAMLRQSICPIAISLAEEADRENDDVRDALQAMIDLGYDRTAYFPFFVPGHSNGAVSFIGTRGPVSAGEMAQLAYVACRAFLRLSQVSSYDTPHNPLTRREAQIFRRIANGLTAEEIGRELGITSHTINYHVANTIHKLGAKNKTNALVMILQNGWLAGTPG